MGRVAKYKKIKSCDPYSKQNRKNGISLDTVGVWGLGDNGRRQKKRSKTAQKLKAQNSKKSKKRKVDDEDGFDVPVGKDEFDINDLMGSVKKQSLPTMEASEKISTVKSSKQEAAGAASAPTAAMAKSLEDEQKEAKLLKLDKQVNVDQQRKAELEKKMQRQDGESKNAYKKRTKAETRQIIQKTSVSKRKTAKLEKKREFLKAKKLKKKGKLAAARAYEQDDDDGYDSDIPPALQQQQQNASDSFITGERAMAAMAAAARDEPVFGEQAERPPIFRQLPRGAAKKSSATQGSVKKQSNTSSEQIEAEQNAMEVMRRKVQAQYAAIRAKRRQGGGGFHL